MTKQDLSTPANNLWTALRGLTDARIGLARAGGSLATKPQLEFQLAHARARDAVHEPLDVVRLKADLEKFAPVIIVESLARDRQDYLMQPQHGRQLAPDGLARLSKHKGEYDLAVAIADGLSARAPQSHAAPLLSELLPALQKENLRLAPLTIVTQGRVAAGDAVAAALGARGVLILIGERPGLSAPDSLGAYLTWQPSEATQDADRNCVSNIRPGGIGYADAAFKIAHLLRAMRERGYSGVALKDETDRLLLENRR